MADTSVLGYEGILTLLVEKPQWSNDSPILVRVCQKKANKMSNFNDMLHVLG